MEYLFSLKINEYFVVIFFWNISLALISCLISYRLSESYYLKKWSNIDQFSKWLFGIIFLFWFFFFPNTAYLFTDIRHLVNYCLDPGPFEACKEYAYIVPIFFTYAIIGIPTFYYALSRMSYVISKLFGNFMGKFFPIIIIPITSLGLMIGLVDRFNSWDIVLSPISVMTQVFSYSNDPRMLLNILSYTLMMYLIYYFIKFTQKK